MSEPCSICYTDVDGNVGHKTKCNHVFHKDCIKSWMEAISDKWQKLGGVTSESKCAPICPYCRQRIKYLKPEPGEKEKPGVHVSLYQLQQEKRIRARKNKIAKQNTSKGMVVAKHCTKNKYIKSKAKMKAKPKPKCIATTNKGTPCRNAQNPKWGKYCGTHKKHFLEAAAALEKDIAPVAESAATPVLAPL